MATPMGYVSGAPIEISNGVCIKIPTVRDVIDDYESYIDSTSVFTVTTREIFATARNVDELTRKFPTVWSLMSDEQADLEVGSYFHAEKTVSMVVMEALSYWTGFPLSVKDESGKEYGFQKLSNGKIIHSDKEWIVDEKEFNKIGALVKEIIGWGGTDDFLIPPKITSDVVYDAWLKMYKRRVREAQRQATTMADKILMFSIMGSSYIPLEEIKSMTLYVFNKIFYGLSIKENYDKSFLVHISPKFDTQNSALKHWSGQWNARNGLNN